MMRLRAAGFWSFVLICIVAALSVAWLDRHQRSLVGPAFVLDGDSFRIDGVQVRLLGIDAPELLQHCRDGTACGKRAKAFLVDMVAGADVTCKIQDYDRFGRALSFCSVAGLDVSSEMAASGWAVIDSRFHSDYVQQAQAAKEQGAGVHGLGGILEPYRFRDGQSDPETGGKMQKSGQKLRGWLSDLLRF